MQTQTQILADVVLAIVRRAPEADKFGRKASVAHVASELVKRGVTNPHDALLALHREGLVALSRWDLKSDRPDWNPGAIRYMHAVWNLVG